MRCTACGHSVSETNGRCIYCGALLGPGVSTDPGKSPDARGMTGISKKTMPPNGPYEDGVYVKVRDLPSDLRDRITQTLKEKGKGLGVDKGLTTRTGPGAEQVTEVSGQGMVFEIPFQKSGRMRRLHPLVLFLIFMGSVGFVGFIMWLTM